MGYGNTGDNALPTTFFKINGLKQGSTEVFFEGKEKKGDKWEVISSKPTKLFGHLTSVEVKEFEWQNRLFFHIRVKFRGKITVVAGQIAAFSEIKI